MQTYNQRFTQQYSLNLGFDIIRFFTITCLPIYFVIDYGKDKLSALKFGSLFLSCLVTIGQCYPKGYKPIPNSHDHWILYSDKILASILFGYSIGRVLVNIFRASIDE